MTTLAPEASVTVIVKRYVPFFTLRPFESRRFQRTLLVPPFAILVTFDQTSLPFVRRTWMRTVAAIETRRLTLTGRTEVGAGGWMMRRAATATAAAFDVPVSVAETLVFAALPVSRTVPDLRANGAAGVNVTFSLHFPPGAIATLQ